MSREPGEETVRHLDYLDGWRGFAIGIVLLGHFGLDRVLPGTSVLGVDLFFVLSGRLMGEILFVRRTPLPTFFRRRFARVYPGLFVFVIAATAIWWSTPLGHRFVAVATALTFTINYSMVYTHPVALLDHLWSLCVEEHSYVILAIMALLLRRAPLPSALAIAVLGLLGLANGVVRTLVLHQDYFSVFWRTDVQIAPIFLSAAIYTWLSRPGARRWAPAWFAPVALLAAIALKLSGNVSLGFGIGTLLLVAAVNTIDFAAAPLRQFLELRWVVQLGLWSFSIYLWQQPFYKMAHDAPPLAAVPLLAMALGAGILSFYFVEQPLRRLINGRRVPAAAPPIMAGATPPPRHPAMP